MAKASTYNNKARRKSRPKLKKSGPSVDLREYLESSRGSGNNVERLVRLAKKIANNKSALGILLSAQALVDIAQHRAMSSDDKTGLLSEAYNKAERARCCDQIGNIAISARLLQSEIPIRANLVENSPPTRTIVNDRYNRLIETSEFAIKVWEGLMGKNSPAVTNTKGLLSELAIHSMLNGFASREGLGNEWVPLSSTLSLDRGGYSGSWFKNRSNVTVWTIIPSEQTTIAHRAQVKTAYREEEASRYPGIPVIAIDDLTIRGDRYPVTPQRVLKEMIYPKPENQRRTRERTAIVLDRLDEYEIDLR